MNTLNELKKAAHEIGLEPRVEANAVVSDCGSFLLRATVADTIHLRAQWKAQMTAQDYVEAALQANNANSARPWPGCEVSDPLGDVAGVIQEAHPLYAYAHVHHPAAATIEQLKDCWRCGFAGGVELNALYGAAFPDAAEQIAAGSTELPSLSPTSLKSPAEMFEPVTRERMESWFSAKGVTQIPYDEEHAMLNLSFDGTGVDVVLTDPLVFNVQISAPVPSTTGVDIGTIMHLCNRENARSALPSACVVNHTSGWWVTSKAVMPVTNGLSDAQLDSALRLGVSLTAGQLRSIMHKL